jgi:hypothetical protein
MPAPLNDQNLEIEVVDLWCQNVPLREIAEKFGIKPYRPRLLVQRFFGRHARRHMDIFPAEAIHRAAFIPDGTPYLFASWWCFPREKQKEWARIIVKRMRADKPPLLHRLFPQYAGAPGQHRLAPAAL